MKSRILLILIVLLILCLTASALFTVDATEYVYVTRFGAHVATYDGGTDSGLKLKWPWPIDSVQRLDRRMRLFDLAGAELLTHDPEGQTIDKTLTISAYVCWRVADSSGVDTFLRTVATPEQAEAVLSRRISSRLGAEISSLRLSDLISVLSPQKQQARMDQLSQRLLEHSIHEERANEGSFREQMRSAYGIELIDIRLRRFNYPPQVREEIFSRIRSERNKKVAEYQSKGLQLSEEIKSQAELEARTILADARANEQRTKAQADADADRMRNQAHARDPQFYAFLRKLDEYQRILGDNKTLLLLSSHRELFDLLFKPPTPSSVPPTKAASPTGTKERTTAGGS